MKASVMHEYGGPEVLRYEDYRDPVPSARWWSGWLRRASTR
jgi:NADPH:quinone reductase-like Zn-dependent oxidoreductase